MYLKKKIIACAAVAAMAVGVIYGSTKYAGNGQQSRGERRVMV